jgi:hypothetical protein
MNPILNDQIEKKKNLEKNIIKLPEFTWVNWRN